ncbi:hypothetical protein GCM10022258_44550 [Aquimarina gracilis]
MLLFQVSFLAAQWEFRDIIKHDNITYPKTSKKASISQQIGITTITIDYHRPAVRNRIIWGKLLPYGKVWRAGAEESTTITFMDNVLVNGKSIGPGKYGLHMIPGAASFTIIFSKNHTQWGSFYYKQEEDALRIKVPIEKVNFHEYLKYDFDPISENKVGITMSWEEIGITFEVEVNEIETTLAVIRDELRTLPRFTWKGLREAALFCWLHDTNLEEALNWIDLSIRNEERFENVFIKHLILKSLSRTTEAQKSLEKSKELGSANKMIYTARESIGHHKSLQKAIEILNLTLLHYPNAYEAYLYMGVSYGWLGQLDQSKLNFEKAKKIASSQKEKDRVITRMSEFKFK